MRAARSVRRRFCAISSTTIRSITRKRLLQRLREDVARHGIELPSGKIFVLTHLRYLGYVFNPVSFFYCYNEAGELAMILSEVNNTFGESHNYWLTPETQQPNAAA